MLETDRLILRAWRQEDLAPFASLNADTEVMRYFEEPQSEEQSARMMTRANAILDEHGITFWAAELKESGNFVGFVGMAPVGADMPFGPTIEIGWRLAKQYWGQGLAPEGAKAALAYGFGPQGYKEVVAFTALVNTPSRRVMEKIGMARDVSADFDHPQVSSGHELERHCLYRISAENFSAL